MTRFLTLLLILCLGACSSSQSLLSKDAPVVVAEDSLIRPPWQTLVKAGPDAEKDVDLETLNGPQAMPPPVLPQVAAMPVEEPPSRPVHKASDTVIKAVAVVPVTGAPGRGNAELTAAMRKVLKEAGWPVLPAPRGDALTIKGQVVTDAGVGGQQPVHLRWSVVTPKGKNLGDVKQNNSVPAGSLDQGWGENAGLAAQAAAGGIFKLIEQFR